MNEHIEDIKTNIRIAKAIDDDMHEYTSYDVQAAYQKNRGRIEVAQRKHLFVRYVMRVAAVLLLPLIASTSILSYLYIGQLGVKDQIAYLEASSAPGIVTRIQLPDSSSVWLNAGSMLRYPSRFEKDNRTVHLTGEGYFEVQSDKAHPFYVALQEGIQVKAHGTKFNISAYEDDQLMETSLETGLVDVISGSRSIPLKPDQQVVFDKKENKFSIRTVNIDEKTAWKTGRLVFRNATLDEVVKQLSRRYNMDITLHKESKKEYRFRATFSTENITQILNYLRLAAPIQWAVADTKQQDDLTYPRQRIDVWLK